MIAVRAKVKYEGQRVRQRANRGSARSLIQSSVMLQAAARESILPRRGPSRIGTPPHTHTGRLPRAITYYVDESELTAVIGTAASIASGLGALHEHGGRRGRQRYLPRPFMRPALLRTRDRLPSHWANSITE